MSAVDPEVRRAQAIRETLPEGGLFQEKEWRVSPRAFSVTEDFADELDKLGYRLSKFVRACNDLYRLSTDGRQPAWIAELLDRGKPAELVDFQREKKFQHDIPLVIRPDVILTDDGYAIAELDNVPGGIGLTAWLGARYSEFGEDIVGGPDGMLNGFESILPGGGVIVVSEEASTYRPEMKWVADRLTARAASSERRWSVVDDSPRDVWEGNVYRFFELFDLANVRCSRQLMTLAGDGHLAVTPPFKPALEEKIWFALFWLKPLEEYWRRSLGERALSELKRVIPYSWMVNPEPLPVHGVLPRLDAHSWEDVAALSQRDRDLVLKVSGFSENAWGSRGVVIAQDIPQAEWRTALNDALSAWTSQPYVLQEFHKGRLFDHPWLNPETGAIETMAGRVRLCPYYFLNGERVKCAGALATICPPDKKLLHGMRDAILAPTSIRPA